MKIDKIATETPEEKEALDMIGHETKLDERGEPVETIYYIYDNNAKLLFVGDHERVMEWMGDK